MPTPPSLEKRPVSLVANCAPRRARRKSTWWQGVLMGLVPLLASADPFPPTWGPPNEPAGPVHFAPVAWPNEPANPADCGTSCGEWRPYSRFQNSLNDPRVRDPSNGGTSPQNYVNVASSCVDTRFPSIYYSLRRGAAMDGSDDVILFRWRVEQIANTYATGPIRAVSGPPILGIRRCGRCFSTSMVTAFATSPRI